MDGIFAIGFVGELMRWGHKIDALLRLMHPMSDYFGLFWIILDVGEDVGDRLGDEGGLVDPYEMTAI